MGITIKSCASNPLEEFFLFFSFFSFAKPVGGTTPTRCGANHVYFLRYTFTVPRGILLRNVRLAIEFCLTRSVHLEYNEIYLIKAISSIPRKHCIKERIERIKY